MPEGEGEEGRSPPAKRARTSCGFDDKQTDMLQEVLRMIQQQNERIETVLRENQELREKLSGLTTVINGIGGYHQQFPAPRILSDQKCSVPLRLEFVNSCSKDKYSTHKIEADDEKPPQVAIYDHNNNIVTSEPFSAMRVQFVAIDGDFDDDHKGQWTEKYFRSKIVPGRPRKGHLLSGELKFRLQNGVGYLRSAKFQDNSSFVPSKKFKLGVMVADERISVRIQEGITESFAVKDGRAYSSKKNPNPSPHDAVYKLSKIAKKGDRHRLLEEKGIKTVEDFLSFYRKSPDDLRKILGKISDQDWHLIISHALKCNPGAGVYSSCLQESNVSHEHEAVFRSNGSNYLQGSCSTQPSDTLQEQLDVQGTYQQISSAYNGLSSGGLSVVPNSSNFQPDTSYQNLMALMQHGQLEVADPQVSSVGNEVMADSSLDGLSSQQLPYSLECNRTPGLDGINGLSHVNPSDWHPLEDLWLDGHVDVQWDSSTANPLRPSTEDLMNEFMSWRDHFYPATPGSGGGSCSAAEQNWGCSPVSEAGSISSYNCISAVSEAGSRSHSHSHRALSTPVRGASSRSHRAFSTIPVRGAGSGRRRALSFSPGRGASSSSNGWPPLPPAPPS